MFDLGKNIRKFRKDNHLTQAELGGKLGVSSQVVSNWERGYSTGISPDMIKKMAALFYVPVDVLIGDDMTNASDKELNTFTIESDLPEKLKDLLASKKMDTEMLSEKTGISEERLDAYIYSRKQPFAEDLIKISMYFDVSVDWLLGLSKQQSISADEENLLYYYALMDDDCKKLLTSEAYLLYVKGISAVAAPEYGRYLDKEKKSYPSSGTEGKRMA